MKPITVKLTKHQQKKLAPAIEKMQKVMDANTGIPADRQVYCICIAQLKIPDSNNALKSPVVMAMPLTGKEATKAYQILQQCIQDQYEKDKDTNEEVQ